MVRLRVSDILNQIERIPSEWVNDVGKEVVESIREVCSFLIDNGVSEKTLEYILRENKYALDVMRLMLGLSQMNFSMNYYTLQNSLLETLLKLQEIRHLAFLRKLLGF